MNNNLVPEVRPDRNGKLVTRHVRAVSGGESRSTFPAPRSMASLAEKYISNIEGLTAALEGVLSSGDYDEVEEVDFGVLCMRLHSMQPHVAEAWHSQISELSDMGYEDLLISVLVNKLSSEDSGYILFAIQNSGEDYSFSLNWNDEAKGTIDYYHAWNIYRGVTDFYKRSFRNRPEDILKADEVTYRDAAAVAQMLALGYANDVPGVVLDDNDAAVFEDISLGYLATEYPDDIEGITKIMGKFEISDADQMRSIMSLGKEFSVSADRIVAIMNERNTIDTKTISEVLNADVQPLSNGVL